MTREHDDDIVRRVHRTLAAVADATPIDPPRADDLRELQEIVRSQATAPGAPASTDPSGSPDPADRTARPLLARHRGNGHGDGWSSRGRHLALAAAVLVVALAAAATWMLRPNPGSPPAVQTDHDGELTLRLEAGWLPDQLAGAEPARTATRGLDVTLDAAVYRSDGGIDVLVVATGIMREAAADAASGALTRLTRADQRTSYGAGGQAFPSAGVGIASVGWGPTSDDTAAVISQVENGTPPSDVRAAGWTTIPAAVGWVPGIARSETVRYGDPALGPWAELATTVGDLPSSEVLDALLPANRQVRLGDRTAWLSWVPADEARDSAQGDGGISLVLWQEADGVIGSVMTRGISDGDIQRIAGEAARVDNTDPAPPVRPLQIGTWEDPDDGAEYAIEAWQDSWRGAANGATQPCWRLRFLSEPEGPAPVCNGSWTFGSPQEGGGQLLYGAVVGPEVASVRVDEGAVEVLPLLPFDDRPGSPQLALAVGSEGQAADSVVSFLDADGAVITTTEVSF